MSEYILCRDKLLIARRFSYNLFMQIGVLTHNYPRFPGDFSGTFVEALCAEFARQTHQVTVWAPFDPAYQRAQEHGTRNTEYRIHSVEHTDNSPPRTPHSALPINLSLYRYIWPDRWHQLGYMRSMQSDLALRLNSYLLSPGMFAAGIARVWREASRLHPAVLHAHWLLPNGFIAAVVSRRLGIPLVVSVPGSDAQVAGKNPLFRSMARFALRQADLLTANSAELRDAVIQIARQGDPALGQAVTAKFDLILYGTDPNTLKPDPTGVAELRTHLGIDTSHSAFHTPHSALILCVGRMVYKKGFDTFIRALATDPLRQRAIIGIMIGNGDQKAEWQALAQALGVADRLRWVGNVPKTEISRYYNACDLLLNPSVSRPADGLNVCVLDAMSCAKPVIGSNVAGNPLAIVDGTTGLIVPEQEVTALAEAIARLVDDAALRQQMGLAARARIEEELGWPHLAQRYLAHFTRLQR